jgi:type II secretory pathway component GspD/PulD (secretin)
MRERLRGRLTGATALLALHGLVSPVLAQGPPPEMPASQLEQRPTRLPPLPATQLDDRLRAQLDGPSKLTMDFPNPTPVQDVLQLLVAGTPFSVVTDPGAKATFSGTLKDVTMRQALASVLLPLNLDYVVQGSVVRVFVRRSVTRLFDVNFVTVQRSVRRGLRSSVGLQAEPASAAASTISEPDVLGDLTRGVQALLSGSGRVHVDRAAGLVQVTDFEDRLEQVAVYLEAVQARASRQVRIAAHVLEVTMYDPSRPTIDWAAVASQAGVRTTGATAGFKVPDMQALLDAIARQGSIVTIATPRVLAMNNEPAVMRVGTQLVSFDTVAMLAKEDPDRTSQATPVFAGLTLVVTAQIASDGIVQLSVSPTYSERTSDVKAPAGGNVPVLAITEADTLVRVQEGETVVISGLIQDRTRLKLAAGVSGLFGGQSREVVKSELVILLTPAVVVPGAITTAGAM